MLFQDEYKIFNHWRKKVIIQLAKVCQMKQQKHSL